MSRDEKLNDVAMHGRQTQRNTQGKKVLAKQVSCVGSDGWLAFLVLSIPANYHMFQLDAGFMAYICYMTYHVRLMQIK